MAESPVGPKPDLNGWKDVASHLGRSVRTVQRWERESGMPVRRVRGVAGDSVFASRAELDAWFDGRTLPEEDPADESGPNRAIASAPSAIPPTAEPLTPPAMGPVPSPAVSADRRHAAARRAVAAAVVVVCVVVATAAWRARPGPPARWTLERGALVVMDAQGRQLWTSGAVAMPLTAEAMAPATPFDSTGSSRVVFHDIDGDGSVEVLATLPAGVPRSIQLFCFESDGTLRFQHAVTAKAHYGSEWYGPPWTSTLMLPARGGGVWAVASNTFFPTVVQKLTPRGEVAAEFWQAGHASALLEAELSGRDVLLVGGTRNEDFGATIAVLDSEQPAGTAPADDERYRCLSCPQQRPLAFVAFPRLELGRLAQTRTAVHELRRVDDGVMALVEYAPPPGLPKGAGCPGGAAWFHLDELFITVKAELVDGYDACHATMQRQGRLDHPFGARDEQELRAVRLWHRNP